MEYYLLTPALVSITFLIVYVLLWKYVSFAKKRGIVAPDVHKPGMPKIPTMGGVVLFALIPMYALLIILFPNTVHRSIPIVNEVLTIIIVTLSSGLIGLIDDFRDLGLKKVFMSGVLFVPFLVFHAYNPRLLVPFVGRIRITILYPLLLIAAVPVVVNAINMVDTHNGVMLTGVLSVLIPLFLWSILRNDYVSAMYLSIAISAVVAMFMWNKYPAKVFLGNVGSYLLGGLLISLIVISGLEYVALVAMFPIILHGFYLLTSIKGLMTRQQIREKAGKPVKVVDGVIYPNLDPNAPFTLTRLLILAYGPMTEKELVKKFYLVFAFSSILALLTGFIMFYPVL